jgi:ABC-type uncharacterized transport system involved in gliding motility auxiliary subunit
VERSFRSFLILLAGIALLATAGAIRAIGTDSVMWPALVGLLGLALLAWAVYSLRAELGGMMRQRRGEIALYTVGVIGVLVALAYLSTVFPVRVDMTTTGVYSLSEQTKQMLNRLEKPVHVTFFHDPMMRETVELYQQFVGHSNGKVTLDLFDPMLNPAQARLRGVEFAGTALVESEGRRLQISGPTETDIANAILRVSLGVQQTACFLDGHGEPDPFSLESHDHAEGAAGHSHGLGTQTILHERHGIAKARHGLETMNYSVTKVLLMKTDSTLSKCNILIVAGPRSPLLPAEVQAIDRYLAEGGNALFMLDPFIQTGLEPIVEEFGVVLEDTMVIDSASHFWTDVSAPAVTDYNRHEITRDLPLTFFPGARSLSPTSQPVPGVSVRPIINSSKESYAGTSRDKAEFNPAKDKPGPATIMVIANRKPEFVAPAEAVLRELRGEKPLPAAGGKASKFTGKSRVAIIGDSDFATNSFFHIMGNGKLFLNTVSYLASQENLIGIEARTYDLPRVNLTNRQMKGTFFLSLVVIPALMALVGIAVWWRQR